MPVTFSSASISELPETVQNSLPFRLTPLNTLKSGQVIQVKVSTMTDLFDVMKAIAQVADDAGAIATHFDESDSVLFVWKH